MVIASTISDQESADFAKEDKYDRASFKLYLSLHNLSVELQENLDADEYIRQELSIAVIQVRPLGKMVALCLVDNLFTKDVGTVVQNEDFSEKFSWIKENPQGMAGWCAAHIQEVFLPDVDNEALRHKYKWIPYSGNENPQKGAIAVPITTTRSFDGQDYEVCLAVVCVTSVRVDILTQTHLEKLRTFVPYFQEILETHLPVLTKFGSLDHRLRLFPRQQCYTTHTMTNHERVSPPTNETTNAPESYVALAQGLQGINISDTVEQAIQSQREGSRRPPTRFQKIWDAFQTSNSYTIALQDIQDEFPRRKDAQNAISAFNDFLQPYGIEVENAYRLRPIAR